MPALLEQLSGRAVLLFSSAGKLVDMGPRARQVLDLAGRVDRITASDLPLEGLDLMLSAEVAPDLEATWPCGPLLLHRGRAAPTPVRGEFVPMLPGRRGLPAWFTFEVPDILDTEPSEVVEEAGSLDGVRVLVAEDSPDNQLLISYFLQGEGAQLVLVENGQEAIDRARAQFFDVVLLDMQMPIVDGFEAASRIRQLHSNLPIVALTANTGDEAERQCLEAGCSHFMTKPINRRLLVELVSELVVTARAADTISGGDFDAELAADPEFQLMIADFVDDLDVRVRLMHQALERGDWDELEGLAHKLKGAAGSFGLPQISNVSSELETCAKDREERAPGILKRLGDLVATATA